MWGELSGVFVFGIEGEMLLGAVAGFLGTLATGNIAIGLGMGLLTGIAIGLLSGFFEVTLVADQIICAIGLLVRGPALSRYLYGSYLAGLGVAAFSLSI